MKHIICLTLTFALVSCNQKDEANFPLGGLRYPKNIAPEDSAFYIYQYKDSLSSMDSLEAANYGLYFLSSFDEPNLSIHPQEMTVFRFIYDEWLSRPIIINLTKDNLIVKQGRAGWLYPDFDIDRLSKQEQEQLRRSEWYFRTGYKKTNDIKWRPYFDSVLKLYPDLKDINSYKTLHRKGEIQKSQKYQYSQKIIPISSRDYDDLIKVINESGFWDMPRESWCKNVPSDGASFTLEANTDTQYKIVGSPSCPDDHRRFTIACQKIVDLAGLSGEIQLLWDGTVVVDSIDLSKDPFKESQK